MTTNRSLASSGLKAALPGSTRVRCRSVKTLTLRCPKASGPGKNDTAAGHPRFHLVGQRSGEAFCPGACSLPGYSQYSAFERGERLGNADQEPIGKAHVPPALGRPDL